MIGDIDFLFKANEKKKVIFSLKTDNINDHPVYVVGYFNNYEINENSIFV